FFSSRRRHTRFSRDWSSDVCSSDLLFVKATIYPCIKSGTKTNFKICHNKINSKTCFRNNVFPTCKQETTETILFKYFWQLLHIGHTGEFCFHLWRNRIVVTNTDTYSQREYQRNGRHIKICSGEEVPSLAFKQHLHLHLIQNNRSSH